MVREADVQRAIVSWLDTLDVYHWRVSLAALPVAGGKFWRKNPMAGHPDLAGVMRGGRYFAIEVKRPGAAARLSPGQKTWREKFEEYGVLYIIATCVEDVRRAFAEVQG